MRRFLLPFVSSALLLVSALPARACINDREVDNAEREFKSHYLAPQPADPTTSPTAEPAPGDLVQRYGPMAVGGLLLVGAFVQTWRRPGARG
jgi:hypothetical protein